MTEVGARVEKEQSNILAKGPFQRLVRTVGPGFITGASDDDPSGIGTYSQAGAQLGFNIGWAMLFTFPLMAAIQEIAARIGRTTGKGISGNLSRHYPASLLYVVVMLLFVANVINIGADLSAMADALKLLVGGPSPVYVITFAVVCVCAIVFLDYTRYVKVLKWTTLSLFAYVVAMFAANVPWADAAKGLFIPHVEWSGAFATTLLAILGTTISPYLFFWQASQEVEEEELKPTAKPLRWAPWQASRAFQRIRADTLVGMAFSNLIALAIVFTTAATLHKAGVTDIASSTDAAKALEPAAGKFAFIIFSAGIIGTGLLAVPVLAGSAAFAVGEALRWKVGLRRRPKEAVAFYATLAAATALGTVIMFTPIDPIKALYWSAVINGLCAVPVMVVMMLMSGRKDIMGEFPVQGWLRALGWLSTIIMAASSAGLVAQWFV
ncbi:MULTISPECIES: Nramp family divalent metal transporter [unclassified Mesorhizobium]|jgi:NRAMP (natural resistance-associated macrophage protein)-like metal ion transporter|uniref:Nramp family divalent metal transporter n=1 Tax=unclassified Mesorhizobium TaxID=325217 RepID=UPI000FE390BA|nr:MULTISPECIES: Nramp family divalent metal transporter [unclassified Mesorhizobium]MDG4895185.1 Nramp family divalent metal transporter [Mesorhizobium sp. WSM4976]RWH68120.1 MAG: divalent metal cation transporter [Mesorhizobium sp.]RWL23920.1 MAG: divalent metal cation transporter [Mesorhizobium sp.]RWL27082.1 MAG: divalent metal cation transporter [Mesorhizobium sp.]RWL35385.1 MAG: divalent metal cation transporter [Mesorhizobium sp.]